MTRTLSGILICLLLAGCRGSSRTREPLQYPPYPSGVEFLSGTLLHDTLGGTDYGLELVRAPSGERLWFARLVERDASGLPLWRLVDTLAVPGHDTTRTLVIGECSFDGRFDPEIIALAPYEATDSFRTVVSAWRADRRLEHFTRLPPTGVVCANVGYGAE